MKNTFILIGMLFAAALLGPLAPRAVVQVGIGAPTPAAKAALKIKASDKGLLIPRLSAGQRAAITSPS